MRVAVTFENGRVFEHFGRSRQFKLYEIQGGVLQSTQIVDVVGEGHGALAGFLKDHGVDTLICGGIGQGAQSALSQAGIALYPGAAGEADEQIALLLAGRLSSDAQATCTHHHEGEHTCSGNCTH